MPKCDFKANLLKSHFGMGVLLQICSIFSEYLFLRTPLSDCFCLFLINLQAEDLQLYLRDSSAGIFLCIMQIF